MEKKELTLDNRRYCYRTTGSGEAVVLIHGFGEVSTVWENQYSIFSGKQLIIPELPGSGSDRIEDMSMEGQASWLKKLLDYLKIEKTVLVGHSMGGYITLAFAEKYWDMLTGFGLCHSTSYADTDEKKETRKKGIEFIRKHGAFEFLKTTTPNLYAPITREKNPAMVSAHIETLRDVPAETLIYYYEAMISRPDRSQVLKEARVPVLFIIGKQDNALPFRDCLQQCHLPSISQVAILENSGHMGMREEPARTNEELRSFITECYH